MTKEGKKAKGGKEKGKEGEEGEESIDNESLHRVWGDMVKLKFVLSLLLTPLVNPLVIFTISTLSPNLLTEDDYALDQDDLDLLRHRQTLEYKKIIQFWVVVILLILSFGTKAYREEVCNDFKEDPINKKLQEIS